MYNESRASKAFDVFLVIFLAVLSLIFLYPLIYIIAMSLSGSTAIVQGRVFLYPIDFTSSAYKLLFRNDSMLKSLLFTTELTFLGVGTSIACTVITAYPLSRSHLHGSGVFMRLIVFTMYFSGGTVPTYMLVRNIGLFNSIWSLILPVAIDTFLLIIMINNFRGLPVELEEAAKVDGSSNFHCFLRIFLPLSKAALATLVVFYAVSYWNTFFNALLYIQDQNRLTLQVKLYQVLNMFSDSMDPSSGVDASIIPENLKGATIVVAVLPILCVYPFMQKYFVKGVTVGAIKG